MKLLLFTVSLSLVWLMISCGLFTTHLKEKTYCLWPGTWLDAFNATGSQIQHKSCQNNDCNQEICKMLWYTPGISHLSVTMLEPTLLPMEFTYIDLCWLVLFIVGAITIILQVILLYNQYEIQNDIAKKLLYE